jgi:4-amino-4-deoxy-L-arabinose transferase-like glycosyltransferase
VSGSDRDRKVTRRRRLLWAAVLAVAGLVLLLLGLTVASGTLAWIEVLLAFALLVASYALQWMARRETFSGRGRG